MKKILVIIPIILLFALPVAADLTPLPDKDVQATLGAIRDYAFTFFLVIAVIFFIIAGYMFVTAAGDTSKYETAKKALLFAIIGTLVAVLSQGIVDFIKDTLAK